MSGQGAVRLTESEREALREAVWPIDPPQRDDRHQIHDRALALVEAIVAARVSSALDEVEALASQIRDDAHALADDERIDPAVPLRLLAIYGRIRHALSTAPVPPADETEPQAGASGDGGGPG